ncbi:hypothetical protein DKX38_002203 [Salix brachista]|uniref:Uncharacterized protein n=1 Tax=Salix brachista TaxID=2182728 RepID=A0A5N5NLE0_9ROSI|nr:hypothetical protein DKX38_002203 [Salix brachista]
MMITDLKNPVRASPPPHCHTVFVSDYKLYVDRKQSKLHLFRETWKTWHCPLLSGEFLCRLTQSEQTEGIVFHTISPDEDFVAWFIRIPLLPYF